jgi:hypothetical protein
MPFTPFHMGPGMAIKAGMQRRFSLMVFGWSQILMDLQPLFVLLTGKGELHGFSHTYVGATLIALISAISGKYLGEVGLKIIHQRHYLPIRWPVAWMSAFGGTYSHIVLDSIMHTDLKPLYPFSQANGLLGFISIEALHGLCIGSGLIGVVIFLLLEKRNPRV